MFAKTGLAAVASRGIGLAVGRGAFLTGRVAIAANQRDRD